MTKSVLIIGAGLGGLFTGAILAKEGLKVTVLEKNSSIGGGLQSFNRFNEVFDTGMHIVCGMQPNGNIRRICRYLGIEDNIKIRQNNSDCCDVLYFEEDHQKYSIASGKEGFIRSLSKYFPDEKENLEEYVKAIFNISNKVDLFNLRPSEGYVGMDFFSSTDDFLMPADVFIAKYIKNPKLRSIVAYTNTLYGGRAGVTPAYIHAIISSSYINGICRFENSSGDFAQLLANVITENGGEIYTNEKAVDILTEGRNITGVKTDHDNFYQSDIYISDIHPCALIKITDSQALPKSYRSRLEHIPNSYSAFSLYIKLKSSAFEYLDYCEYFMTDYSKVWDFGNVSDQWPLGFMFMTPPRTGQGKYAATALVTAPMPFDVVRQWENTVSGHRGHDYEAFKQIQTFNIIKQLDKLHPGFQGCIENVLSSTPLTIRDYYGVVDGALFGYSKDCNNIILSQVPVATKLSNLFLTGQNVNLHGFCGVPLTAVMTSEAVLGNNYIINKLRNEE